MRPNHLGDIYQKKMRPAPKNFAQMAKFRQIWSHWIQCLFQYLDVEATFECKVEGDTTIATQTMIHKNFIGFYKHVEWKQS
jgi:hypothetical protein